MLDHGTLTQEDINIQLHRSDLPNLGPNFRSPEALQDVVNYYSMYNEFTTAGACPLTPHITHNLPRDPEQRAIKCQLEQMAKEFHQNQHTELNQDIDMFDPNDEEVPKPEDNDNNSMMTPVYDEDSPNPFEPSPDLFMTKSSACNAFLAILTCLLAFLSPKLKSLFITLQSATQVLGLDMPVTLLPTCPGCRNVYPPVGSPHTQDACVPFSLDLFLPNKTK
ncbi:hypothetical protein PAXRUDRAFT_36589 [Paxillus rubicundulus Ve08.2h10]|uniref:Uncharacterized protein n=1 Tax=Paxillus rubicundulus Ve08.2h10 TaxID=930991 RepID=A0A0D0D4V1_9AGAM|nr:hypothetical protein PAXRUDRAFT_36589 [Paxillus rubicundulus Ve08.2h10]